LKIRKFENLKIENAEMKKSIAELLLRIEALEKK